MVDGQWKNRGTGAFQPMNTTSHRNCMATAKVQRNLMRDYFVSPACSVYWQVQHSLKGTDVELSLQTAD